MFLILILVNTYKALVAPDFVGNCSIRGARTVVVDNRTSIADICKDIEKGRMGGYRKITLLVARADFVQRQDVSVVLERLKQVVKKAEDLMSVSVTGPIPRHHDKEDMCVEFRRVCREMRKWCEDCDVVHYLDLSEMFYAKEGVAPFLIGHNGLTRDGVREIELALYNF